MKVAKDDTPPDALPIHAPKRKPKAPVPALRSMDQILGIFNNGEFLPEVIAKMAALQIAMAEHRAAHNGKAKGSFTLQIAFEQNKMGDVSMTAVCETKAPKTPPSSAVAYVTDEGLLTLYSPMMAMMQVRDTFDPETGEIR
jgi:hypothetical protein